MKKIKVIYGVVWILPMQVNVFYQCWLEEANEAIFSDQPIWNDLAVAKWKIKKFKDK